MLHKWYESTDVTGNFVRVPFLDYSKAFVTVTVKKKTGMEVPAHLVGRMAAFLIDREHRVKIGDAVKDSNGGVHQVTLLGPKHSICKRLVLFINMLTTALYLKYAAKTWCLLSRILLTLLSNGLVIMTCASTRVKPGAHESYQLS